MTIARELHFESCEIHYIYPFAISNLASSKALFERLQKHFRQGQEIAGAERFLPPYASFAEHAVSFDIELPIPGGHSEILLLADDKLSNAELTADPTIEVRRNTDAGERADCALLPTSGKTIRGHVLWSECGAGVIDMTIHCKLKEHNHKEADCLSDLLCLLNAADRKCNLQITGIGRGARSSNETADRNAETLPLRVGAMGFTCESFTLFRAYEATLSAILSVERGEASGEKADDIAFRRLLADGEFARPYVVARLVLADGELPYDVFYDRDNDNRTAMTAMLSALLVRTSSLPGDGAAQINRGYLARAVGISEGEMTSFFPFLHCLALAHYRSCLQVEGVMGEAEKARLDAFFAGMLGVVYSTRAEWFQLAMLNSQYDDLLQEAAVTAQRLLTATTKVAELSAALGADNGLKGLLGSIQRYRPLVGLSLRNPLVYAPAGGAFVGLTRRLRELFQVSELRKELLSKAEMLDRMYDDEKERCRLHFLTQASAGQGGQG